MAAGQHRGSCEPPLGVDAPTEGAPFDRLRTNGGGLSRRAVLGAALGVSFVGAEEAAGAARPLQYAPHDSHPRSGEEWTTALAAFRAAQARVRAVEGATAGGSMAEEERLEGAYDSALDAMHGALRRLMRAPAPDLGAFAAKLELFFDHELEPHSAEADALAAVRRDAWRLMASR
jgi:hypothetical protein